MTAVGADAEPFFEPLPEPEPVEDRPPFYPQLPWQPPINVVPVIVPLGGAGPDPRHGGVPARHGRLPSGAHQAAAASAGELWELPPVPEGAEFGWFGYAPMTGAHRSQVTITPDTKRESTGQAESKETSDGD